MYLEDSDGPVNGRAGGIGDGCKYVIDSKTIIM